MCNNSLGQVWVLQVKHADADDEELPAAAAATTAKAASTSSSSPTVASCNTFASTSPVFTMLDVQPRAAEA